MFEFSTGQTVYIACGVTDLRKIFSGLAAIVVEAMLIHQSDTDYSFIDHLLPWSPEIPEFCRTNQPNK